MKADFTAKKLDSQGMLSFIEELQEGLSQVVPHLLKPTKEKDMIGLESESGRGDGLFTSELDLQKCIALLSTYSGSAPSPCAVESSMEVAVSAEELLVSIVALKGHPDRRVVQMVIPDIVGALERSRKDGLEVALPAYEAAMAACNRASDVLKNEKKSTRGQNYHKTCINLFSELVLAGHDPSQGTYGELITSYALVGKAEEAEQRIDGVIDVGMQPPPSAYAAVLRAHLHSGDMEAMDRFWLRTKADGVVLDKDHFHCMLTKCEKQHEAERALFLFDEMVAESVEPDVKTFGLLFRAVATAPHHVSGFQDILFEVMAKCEGAELMPDAELYGNIISAFGRAGDADASLFYYEEMLRKGIPMPNEYVQTNIFNSLLQSLAWHQAVDVGPYPYKGRYVEPRKVIGANKLEEAVISLGLEETSKIMSRGLTLEGALYSSKGVRKKPILVDNLAEAAGDPAVYEEEVHDALLEAAEEEGTWRLDELRRRELEAYERRRKPSYVGFYTPDEEDRDPAREISGGNVKVLDARTADDAYERDGEDAAEFFEDVAGSDEGVVADSREMAMMAADVDSLLGFGDAKGGVGNQNRRLSTSSDGEEDLDLNLDLDAQWALIEFGRAPEPDYSESLLDVRWPRNFERADRVMQDIARSGLTMTVKTMNMYLAVFTEAKDRKRAEHVLNVMFSENDITPDHHTCDHLIRMHVRRKDITRALQCFDEMQAQGIRPGPKSYSLLIDALTARDELVHALKLVEQAADNNISIRNKHLVKLRGRCKKLGVKHPNLESDTRQWFYDMVAARKKLQNTRSKTVETVSSATFSKQ